MEQGSLEEHLSMVQMLCTDECVGVGDNRTGLVMDASDSGERRSYCCY